MVISEECGTPSWLLGHEQNSPCALSCPSGDTRTLCFSPGEVQGLQYCGHGRSWLGKGQEPCTLEDPSPRWPQLFLFPQVETEESDRRRQPASGRLSGSRQSCQPLPCWSNPRTRAPLHLICPSLQETVKCFWLISYACIIRW